MGGGGRQGWEESVLPFLLLSYTVNFCLIAEITCYTQNYALFVIFHV